MASILLGNVKGPQGDTGATGPKGDTGNAATVSAGSVTTVPYGQNARVTNSGDEHNAIFDFVIPQGRPGEQTTDMQNLTLSSMTEPSEQFPVPAIGETGKVIFGKITKWFSDMAALVATKLNASNVVNNLTTTASGYALDARQGKALNDAIAAQSQLFYKNSEQFQLLFFTNKGWDAIFSESPVSSVAVIRESGQNQYPFASNNYIGLQWKNGSGAYGTQLVFGYGGTPAYRNCTNNVWSAWQNLD